MSGERFVVLGVAHARAEWFRRVAQWATSASIPAEFIKCVSGEEVRARLASGRMYSALVVDEQCPAFERDLVATAVAAYTPVIVVTATRSPTWNAGDLGVAALLAGDFSRNDLLAVLTTHARMISEADQVPAMLDTEPGHGWQGSLVAVCGPGGSGTSVLAMALAQGLAADVRYGRRVVLADLALRADQAMLHDTGELGPGLLELVDAHRRGRPGAAQVWASTFEVPRRGYRLLIGLRRSTGWSALRPRAVDATLTGLRAGFQMVVADVTADFEGEADGGSIDVEERNHLARSTVRQADVVIVVGTVGLKGLHSLARVIEELRSLGVDPARILPVLNRAPRSPRLRSEATRALAALTTGAGRLCTPVQLPERPLEEVLRDGTPLPAGLVRPLVGAFEAVRSRQADLAPTVHGLEPIVPGSLGTWAGTD